VPDWSLVQTSSLQRPEESLGQESVVVQSAELSALHVSFPEQFPEASARQASRTSQV
jgi:hypothetical protein